MNIFYESSTKSWWHDQPELPLTFGVNQIEIPYVQKEITSDSITFHLDLYNKHEIFTVGILTTANMNELGFGGNLSLFRSLHLYLLKYGILSYVITAEDVLKQEGYGYIFSIPNKKWHRISVPLPLIVYNRIPLRSFESSYSFQKLKNILSKQKVILFNPCFIDKYNMYTTLIQHEKLKQLLPKTIAITTFKKFADFVHIHQTIYLKPREGNRGDGIYLLTQQKDYVDLKSPEHSESFLTLSEYWNCFKKQLLEKKYIAQQAIAPKKKNGHRYDYRLLVHYEQGLYKLSGKAVRMSQNQEITTHVPKGGKLYPYEEVATKALDQQLTDIAQTCGMILSNKLGLIGEFSIDLGENEAGELYIYEVNSKPMQFDEKEIEENRLLQLKNLFIELINNK